MTPSTHLIWYAKTSNLGSYRTRGGIPVWPIVCDDDLSALEALAPTWGFELQRCAVEELEVTAPPGDDPATSGGPLEVVVAYGPGTAALARVYAHLTGRRLLSVDQPGNLPSAPGLAVVVALEASVTPDLLDVMFPPLVEARVPGLIVAPTPESLRRRCLCCAATAVLRCRRRNVIYYMPSSPDTVRVSGLKTTAGKKTSASETNALLTGGSGLLVSMTHSNGIDAKLTAGQVLCAVKGRGDLGSRAIPNCIATSHCRVLNRPMAEALEGDRLVEPTRVRAGILVWYTCYGLLSTRGPVDLEWGLARLMWLRAPIGALLTPLANIVHFDTGLSRLGDDVGAGVDIGTSLSRHLRRSAHLGNRFCLLGDPRAALDSDDRSASLPRSELADRDTKPFCAWLGNLTLYRLYFAGLDKYRVWEGVDEAVQRIESFERLAWMPSRIVRRAVPALNAALATAISGPMPVAWSNNWMSYTDLHSSQVVREGPCASCGRPVTTWRWPVAIPGASARDYTRCWHCQAVDDVPAGFEGQFVAHDGVARLLDPLPFNRDGASLMLRILGGAFDLRRLSWPMLDDGPCSEFRPAERWPPGDISVALVFVHEGEVAVLTRIVRDHTLD